MKIGRNQLCPCGSGKKYKKCCLNKSVTNTQFSNLFSSYSYINSDSHIISKILEEYCFEDVAIAVFCINSWRANRSGLAQSLILNQGLSMCSSKGCKRIITAEDFSAFWNKVSPYLKITVREDYTLPDFGEAFINIKGKSYPIILGTGHQSIYAAMRYMVTLAKLCAREDELITVLDYLDYIISSLNDFNQKPQKEEIVFENPPFEYFTVVKSLFSDSCFLERKEKVSGILGHQDGPIEMRHFVRFKDCYYPLFNTSILVDYYKQLQQLATKEQLDNHIKYTILAHLEETYSCAPENGRKYVLVAPRILSSDKKVLWSTGLLFALLDGSKILLGVLDDGTSCSPNIEQLKEIINSRYAGSELYLVEGIKREKSSGYFAVSLVPEMKIEILLFDTFTDLTATRLGFCEDSDSFSCSALDLFYLLSFSDNIEEIIAFIEYSKSETAQIMTFGGVSNLFFLWKASNQNISSGAIEYSLIDIDYNETDTYTYNYFEDTLSNFPRNCEGLFADPIVWHFEEGPNGYSAVSHKKYPGFGGDILCVNEENFFFLAHNAAFFETYSQSMETALLVIDELNQKLFRRYSDVLKTLGILRRRNLEILFMPIEYVEKNLPTDFIHDVSRSLVYSESYVDSSGVIIRYSLNPDTLLSRIRDASNRFEENLYFIELLKPLSAYGEAEYNRLCEQVSKDNNKKKTVSVFSVEREYYFSEAAINTTIQSTSFSTVRKIIAKSCFNAGIIPGVYRGKDATLAIRKMQDIVCSIFEEMLSEFEKESVHKMALSYYAFQRNQVILQRKRLLSFSGLDEETQKEFEQQARQSRETGRRYARMSQYLIECNLAAIHTSTDKKCSAEDFNILLAFADWLIVLQDSADLCHHTEWDVQVSIDEEYLVDPVYEDNVIDAYEKQLLRKYSLEEYSIKNDELDRQYLEKSFSAFQKDTGISFTALITLLEYLELTVTESCHAKEIYPNVYKMNRVELINDLVESLEDDSISKQSFEAALRFITLEEGSLKTVAGKTHSVVPVWEREKRNNRFDVRPVVQAKDDCIFSPIVAYDLGCEWKSGLLEWFLPYEIGLDELQKTIKLWKKRYEDEMVQDIAKAFQASRFTYVFPEVDLANRFPKDDYPAELGDYDVIAISDEKKEIWIIESKVLQKVGSVYEDQMQQKNFFIQNRYDEKFQRRINFFQDNCEKILCSFQLDSCSGYSICPAMVTNKLFVSRYKKIGFPIYTFHEFEQILRGD